MSEHSSNEPAEVDSIDRLLAMPEEELNVKRLIWVGHALERLEDDAQHGTIVQEISQGLFRDAFDALLASDDQEGRYVAATGLPMLAVAWESKYGVISGAIATAWVGAATLPDRSEVEEARFELQEAICNRTISKDGVTILVSVLLDRVTEDYYRAHNI